MQCGRMSLHNEARSRSNCLVFGKIDLHDWGSNSKSTTFLCHCVEFYLLREVNAQLVLLALHSSWLITAERCLFECMVSGASTLQRRSPGSTKLFQSTLLWCGWSILREEAKSTSRRHPSTLPRRTTQLQSLYKSLLAHTLAQTSTRFAPEGRASWLHWRCMIDFEQNGVKISPNDIKSHMTRCILNFLPLFVEKLLILWH